MYSLYLKKLLHDGYAMKQIVFRFIDLEAI